MRQCRSIGQVLGVWPGHSQRKGCSVSSVHQGLPSNSSKRSKQSISRHYPQQVRKQGMQEWSAGWWSSEKNLGQTVWAFCPWFKSLYESAGGGRGNSGGGPPPFFLPLGLYSFSLICFLPHLAYSCHPQMAHHPQIPFTFLLCQIPIYGIPCWRRKWQTTLVYLPGESHGQRSLVGYSPWGHTELDNTEWLSMHAHLPLGLFSCSKSTASSSFFRKDAWEGNASLKSCLSENVFIYPQIWLII